MAALGTPNSFNILLVNTLGTTACTGSVLEPYTVSSGNNGSVLGSACLNAFAESMAGVIGAPKSCALRAGSPANSCAFAASSAASVEGVENCVKNSLSCFCLSVFS